MFEVYFDLTLNCFILCLCLIEQFAYLCRKFVDPFKNIIIIHQTLSFSQIPLEEDILIFEVPISHKMQVRIKFSQDVVTKLVCFYKQITDVKDSEITLSILKEEPTSEIPNLKISCESSSLILYLNSE